MRQRFTITDLLRDRQTPYLYPITPDNFANRGSLPAPRSDNAIPTKAGAIIIRNTTTGRNTGTITSAPVSPYHQILPRD
jgi:hypothetical protein